MKEQLDFLGKTFVRKAAVELHSEAFGPIANRYFKAELDKDGKNIIARMINIGRDAHRKYSLKEAKDHIKRGKWIEIK